MDLIQVKSGGKQLFRIIVKKNILTKEDLRNIFCENMVFVSLKIANIYEANEHSYIDLPVEDCIGTDFIRLLRNITSAEFAHVK